MRKNLKDDVENILRNFPQARDSDNWLTIKLWCVLYPSKIDRTDPNNPKIALSDIMNLPTEDNCKRIRAKIQNEEGKYLPTSWEVAKQRRINEQEWRNYVKQ